MPEMNGDEVFRELRRIRDDVGVILSSGYDEEEVTSRFAGRGLAGFLQKPYRPNTLVAKVGELLKARGCAVAAGTAIGFHAPSRATVGGD